MAHPTPNAKIRLCTDALDFIASAALEQFDDCCQPLAFFFKKFLPAHARYSMYHHELTPIYFQVILRINTLATISRAGSIKLSRMKRVSFML